MLARRMLAAFPDVALGGVFLVTWISPFAVGRGSIEYLLLVMLLEFIIIHSSAFMGHVMLANEPRRRRAKKVLGLGVLYTLFVLGFALGFGTVWPLVAFWALTLNRLSTVLLGAVPEGQERLHMRGGWAANTLFYLVAVGLTTPWRSFPALGVTRDVLREIGLPASGLWVEQPYRVLAAGFFYFTAVGISELFGHVWTFKGLPHESA